MTLFFYLLKEYLKYVIGTLLLCVFLFILFDFIHKTTKYIPRYEPTGIELLQYYYYWLPSQLIQAFPIAALLSSVTAMALLARNNELTAMRAVGLGPLAIATPLLAGGAILCAVGFFIGEVVLPKFSQKLHYLKEVVIEGEKAFELADGAKWLRQGHTMISFNGYDPAQKVLKGIRMITIDNQFRPKDATFAGSATYRPIEKDWVFEDMRVVTFDRYGVVKSNHHSPPEIFQLPVQPEELRKERRKPGEMSLLELHGLIKKAKVSGQASLGLEVDFFFKIAYPFAALVVSLVGLQFMYLSERTTDTIKGVLMAFGIGVAYWFILIAARALASRGDVPPSIAAWFANFGVLSASIFQTWYRRTG